MHTFPVTQVDNFFDDPDKIRNYALSLDYHTDPGGNWPGERSECLSGINYRFYSETAMKILRVFYPDLTLVGVGGNHFVKYSAQATFQKVSKKHFTNRTASKEGWIHSDYPVTMTAILYLTPGGSLDNGTSIYKLKDDIVTYDSQYNIVKKDSYTNNNITDDIYKQGKNNNNSQFIETARVGGSYNSLVCFDSAQFHGARNFETESDEDRLTMVWFFHSIMTEVEFPVMRSRREVIKV